MFQTRNTIKQCACGPWEYNHGMLQPSAYSDLVSMPTNLKLVYIVTLTKGHFRRKAQQKVDP